LTENFTDYPQGQSVDYMRGIAYYGLMDYKNAHEYFDLYVGEVLESQDESWADPKGFLYKGLAYLSENKNDSAIEYFDKVIKYDVSLADGYYHKVRALLALHRLDEARSLIDKALTQFQSGSNHKRPYVEVMDQIYIEDIEELKKKLDDK
ncbi:MAG: tetratricopeptide repeat protein, partial [Bacteroidota bacterium]